MRLRTLKKAKTMAIREDSLGNIWIATIGVASCYKSKFFPNFTTKEGLTNNDVSTTFCRQNKKNMVRNQRNCMYV